MNSIYREHSRFKEVILLFNRIGVLILACIFVVSSVGCGKVKTQSVRPNEYKSQSVRPNEYNSHSTRSDLQQHSAAHGKIEKQVSGIKGVNKATVLVHDRDAIVAIDVKQGENVKSVENKVRQTVQRSDPEYRVHVTTDRAHHTRIQQIRSQMVPLDGHPVRNFAEDVGILIQDIGRAATRPFR